MKANFNSVVNSDIPVLIDFYAEWCQPCKVQSPILVEVAREFPGKVKVIKIDVDKNPEIAMRYQIQGVPTLALFKNGSLLWRQAGVTPKVSLIQILNSKL